MSSLSVVVGHPFRHNGFEFMQCPCIEEQGSVLGLEATVEGLNLRVIAGSVQGIGHPHMLLQQQLGSPAIAGEDRILVVMDNHALQTDVMASQGLSGPSPGGKRQPGHGMLTDSPAKHELGGMVDDGDE